MDRVKCQACRGWNHPSRERCRHCGGLVRAPKPPKPEPPPKPAPTLVDKWKAELKHANENIDAHVERLLRTSTGLRKWRQRSAALERKIAAGPQPPRPKKPKPPRRGIDLE